MPKRHSPYPPEFREQILNLYRNGSTVAELAEEFEPHRETIKNWIRSAGIERGEVLGGAKSESAEEENKRLRKELRRLQQERDILAKAAAWFARETNSIPKGPSNS